MQEVTDNTSQVGQANGVQNASVQEDRLQEKNRTDGWKRRVADNKDIVNAVRLATAAYVLNYVLYDMKDRYNQRAKMLINNAVKHSNKLVDMVEKNFDDDAIDDSLLLAENYLKLLDEFLVCKNQPELFALIAAYNDGDVKIEKHEQAENN